MFNVNIKLFGYKDLFNHFIRLNVKKKFPNRLLLTGQDGIGKTTFAFHLTNYLLSENEKTKYIQELNQINPDSVSNNLVTKNSHPNFFLIFKNDDKQNIDVEQIRSMISFLNKSSFNNLKKIILIDGVENLNNSSSNSLLKSLEESNDKNYFILTHNINKKIKDTIRSRCLNYKLNFNYLENKNIINEYFNTNLYDNLNNDFKTYIISPKFLINHIFFCQENEIDIQSFSTKKIIKFIVENKSYKKFKFVSDNFQSYIELYFINLYFSTKEIKYYELFLKNVEENNLIKKFNLDLDSFFIKFQNKYIN